MHICTARNICAHGSALFDVALNQAIIDGPAGKMQNNKQNLQGILTIVHYILTQISVNRAADFKREIGTLFDELNNKNPHIYPQIAKITGYNEDFFKK